MTKSPSLHFQQLLNTFFALRLTPQKTHSNFNSPLPVNPQSSNLKKPNPPTHHTLRKPSLPILLSPPFVFPTPHSPVNQLVLCQLQNEFPHAKAVCATVSKNQSSKSGHQLLKLLGWDVFFFRSGEIELLSCGWWKFGPFRETQIVGSRVVAICLSRYAVVRF